MKIQAECSSCGHVDTYDKTQKAKCSKCGDTKHMWIFYEPAKHPSFTKCSIPSPAIDHNRRRSQQHLKMILSACSNLTEISTKEAFAKLQQIRDSAETALVYLGDPPIDPEEVGEWLDITTNNDAAKGYRVTMNTVTGDKRHVPTR